MNFGGMPRGRKVRNTNSVAAVWRTNARARRFFILVDAFFFSVGAFHFFLFFSLTRLFCGEKSRRLKRGGRVFSRYTQRESEMQRASSATLSSSRERVNLHRGVKKKSSNDFLEKEKISPPISLNTRAAQRARRKKTNRRLTFLLVSLSRLSLSLGMRNAQDLGFLSSDVDEYRQQENVIRGGEEKSGVRERERARARALLRKSAMREGSRR